MDIDLSLSKGQAEFLRRTSEELVIMSCSISYGKSFIAALWIITELIKGHKILAAAQSHGALRKVLYDHVFNLCSKYHIPYDRNKEDRSIMIGKGICYGYSGEAPEDVLGMTNSHGFIMDEAARCPEKLYTNLCERCRGEGVDIPMHRLISSPLAGEPSAEWFLNLKKENPDSVIHGSLYENPFISKRFIKSMEKIYPKGTKLYDQQILGLDIDSDFLNAIIKSDEFPTSDNYNPSINPYFYGMDLSGMGRDNTVAYIINKTGIVKEYVENRSDSHTQTAIIREAYESYNISDGALDFTGGYGTGPYDNVKNISSINIRPVMFSEKPYKDFYRNCRAEMYMELAQAIKDGFYIDKANNPLLVEELRHTKAYTDELGKLRIIPKEMIKKEIGRSPDRADALALAVYAKNHPMPKKTVKEVLQAALKFAGI